MVCKNCGKELNENQKFCDNCGAPVNVEQTYPAANEAYRPESAYVYGAPTTQPPKEDKSSALFFLLGLFIPLAGIICFAVMHKDTPKKAKSAIIGMVVRVVILTILMIILYVFVFSIGYNGYKNSTSTSGMEYTVNVGEYVQSDELKITYTYCNANAEDYGSYYTVPSGYKVVRADFEVENVSESEDYVYLNFSCYADGLLCDENYSGNDRNTIGETLSSGRKTTGTYYFDVPDSANEIEIEADNFSSDKVIFVVE